MWEIWQTWSTQEWLQFALAIGTLVGVILFGQRLLTLILKRGILRLTRLTRSRLDDVLVEIARVPLYWLFIALAFQVTRPLWPPLTPTLDRFWDDAIFLLYFWAVFLFLWRLIDIGTRWYGQEIARRTETPLDEQLMPFFRRLLLIFLVLIGLVMVLDHFGVNPTAVLTTLGIGSLAIALAAQTALSDAINGFLIMVDRPFRIGDRIEILELNTWGDVLDIGLRSTRIRTTDNRMVIVPNSIIGQSLVVNHSYPDLDYRMHALVGIAYGSDVDKAKRVMEEAIRRSPGVLPYRPVHVLFVEMGDSALIFRLQWWVRIQSELDRYQMYDSVLTSVYKALNEAGITIPFPQRDVHHKVDPEDREVLAALLHSRGDRRP